jgi:hypothetical protein
VWEAFTEMRLPIASDLPFAYNLSAEGGYRYSNYTLGGTTNTYKFGLEWAPIQDIRLRGGYNRKSLRLPKQYLQRQHLGGYLRYPRPLHLRAREFEVLSDTGCAYCATAPAAGRRAHGATPPHGRNRAAPAKAHCQARALFAKKDSAQVASRPAAICTRRVRISSR